MEYPAMLPLQMVALEAAIKEEHMARWNPAICQVRKPRKKEGEVGFAAAVLERITKQWPDLHSWLLSTDVDLIKKHIWKGKLGGRWDTQQGAGRPLDSQAYNRRPDARHLILGP